jgi:hypothetical protein
VLTNTLTTGRICCRSWTYGQNRNLISGQLRLSESFQAVIALEACACTHSYRVQAFKASFWFDPVWFDLSRLEP